MYNVGYNPAANDIRNTFLFLSEFLSYFWANSIITRYFSITNNTPKDFTSLTLREKK